MSKAAFTHDVFLSYSSKDMSVVRPLAERLKNDGLRVWFDEWMLKPGDSVPARIDDGLEHSSVLVLCMSANAFGSDWAQLEAGTFRFRDPLNKERRFIPLRLDDAPIKGSLTQFLYINWLPPVREEGYKKLLARLGAWPDDLEPSPGEVEYGLGFGPPGFRIAYLPARSGPWQEHYDEILMEKLKLEVDRTPFTLPQRFQDWVPARRGENLARCRLASYTNPSGEMSLTLSRTNYEDYLRSGELIDFTTTPGSSRTLRAEFLASLKRDRGYLDPFDDLTNICGVGILVITRDNKVVCSSHSETSHVYPGRLTFSASGTMPWGAWPHPYTAVLQKAHEEIRHLVDPRKLKLFAFGVDARKLYFQFSFVEERTDFTFDELKDHYERSENLLRNAPRTLIPIRFDVESVCKAFLEHCWEPAAEAALLALLAKRFPMDVERTLEVHRPHWWRRAMRDEWDHRSSRPELLPDMSVRYDRGRLAEESRRYVDHVMEFLGEHIRGKHVAEIGSGTGRLSERLIELVARPLICIELSPQMIARHREKLADRASAVRYIEGFAQDVLPGNHYDFTICSLVLIHNVEQQSFETLVRSLCQSSGEIFLFEDVRQDRKSSPATRLRTREELRRAFVAQGFQVLAEEMHELFDDQILFLRLAGPGN